MGLNGVRGIDGDLVICLITVLNREIVVLEIDVQEGQNQVVLDVLPDDASHLIAIKLNNLANYLDFAHFSPEITAHLAQSLA